MKRTLSHKYVLVLFVASTLAGSAAASGYLSNGQSVQASKSPLTSIQTDRSVALAALVKAPRANLREKPSVSGGVVKIVEKGDLLTLISSNAVGPWYLVRDGRVGPEAWIHGNTIALLYGDPSATELSPEPNKAQRPRITSPPASGKTYINVDGQRVQSPVFSDKIPVGATARCRDGSYSFSQHRQGTCSHHGGVAEWL